MNESFTFDKILLFVVLTLVTIGIIMIYSASAIYSEDLFSDSNRFLYRQLTWAILGVCAMIIFYKFDYNKLIIPTYCGLLLAFISLILVLIPSYGIEINGARRWLSLGFFQFQPSESAKLFITCYLAYFMSKNQDRIHEFKKTLLPLFVVLGIYFGLIILEPDLGSVIIMAGIVVGLLYLAGARILHLFLMGLSTLPILYIFIWNVKYRRDRVLSFLEPEKDPLNTGFQLIQSKIAIASGQLTGCGLGDSVQKLRYLPEAHTDFIYSILCEEMGFMGGCTVIILYCVFAWRGMLIAKHAENYFGLLLAAGITLMISIQAFTNMAVVMGTFPTKGLALPLISSGGSSLITNMVGIGILLNISRNTYVFSKKVV